MPIEIFFQLNNVDKLCPLFFNQNICSAEINSIMVGFCEFVKSEWLGNDGGDGNRENNEM